MISERGSFVGMVVTGSGIVDPPPGASRLSVKGWVLAAIVAVLVSAVLPLGGPQVAIAAAPTCASQNITLDSAQGVDPVFYTDLDTVPKLDSQYSGWRVTNSGPTTLPNLWVRLNGFTSSGLLTPRINSNEPNAYSLGDLAPAEGKMSYTYLTATDLSSAPQDDMVQVWNGDPRLASSTQLCETPSRYIQVEGTIQAAANKVTGTLVGPNPPGVGCIVQLTVLGQGTGTIGSGSAERQRVIHADHIP